MSEVSGLRLDTSSLVIHYPDELQMHQIKISLGSVYSIWINFIIKYDTQKFAFEN